MMTLISKWIAEMMDYLLGWMLYLHRDLAIAIVAVGTSIILTAARKLTTNQDLMRRCRDDLRRLKQLKRQANGARDKLTLKRIQTTVAMINLTRMKAEGWGLLASLLPIILLASWAFERLDFLPPRNVNDAVEVRATYPATSIGAITWLTADPPGCVQIQSFVPGKDGKMAPGKQALQLVRLDENIDPLTGAVHQTDAKNGLATWRLTVLKPARHVNLRIAYGGTIVEHPLRVGHRSYETPLILHLEDKAWPDCTTQVVMPQAWFFSFLPGADGFWKWWVNTSNAAFPAEGFWIKALWCLTRVTLLAPWLTAYLVITIPFVPLLRKATRVY